METLMFIGRILFSIMFILGGVNHFAKLEGMTGYAQHKGVPAAKLAVPASGAALLLGGLSVVLGVWADLGALVVSVLSVVLAVTMHGFWKETDAQAKQSETISFLKNISMAGGGLFMFALMSLEESQYGPAITDSLFKTSL